LIVVPKLAHWPGERKLETATERHCCSASIRSPAQFIAVAGTVARMSHVSDLTPYAMGVLWFFSSGFSPLVFSGGG
jgi:hypothetical protein